MSKARRARIFAQHGGICGISGRKIGPDDAWHVEHRIPWAISFDDSDENLYPALVEPHKVKSAVDARNIAKAKRIEARINGTRRERKPIPSRRFQAGKTVWPKRSFDKRPKGEKP